MGTGFDPIYCHHCGKMPQDKIYPIGDKWACSEDHVKEIMIWFLDKATRAEQLQFLKIAASQQLQFSTFRWPKA